jgi:uncharacterized membrane protein
MTIDAERVAVTVIGATVAFVVCTLRRFRGESDAYWLFRTQLGRTILLGLELLVAGDIVHMVAATPALTLVAIPAAIVVMRTLLSFSLEVEITGRWPWHPGQITSS